MHHSYLRILSGTIKLRALTTAPTAAIWTILKIAASVEYGDINYFSRIFKKIMKVSPSGFRSR